MISVSNTGVPSHTLKLQETDGVPYYTFPAFSAVPFIRHGFSTRLGGVSDGIYESMNLSFTRGDRPAAVRENFERFCTAIGVDAAQVVVSAQTHTTNVYVAHKEDCGRGISRERGYTDIDGLITNEPGVVLCTQYADCVPLFFADPVRRVVGTAHSGWKGTVARIGAEMVRRMQEEFGCDPQDILAGIGPSIGPCCFEVDTPVYEAFAALPFTQDGCIVENGGGKYHIDLWEVNRRILLEAGLDARRITVTDLCTRCYPDVFWSHRATGGERGSLAGFIAIEE